MDATPRERQWPAAQPDFEALPERFPAASAANDDKRRWAISYRSISKLAALLDVLIIVVNAILSGVAYSMYAYGDVGDVTRNFLVSIFVAIIFVLLIQLRKLYDPIELLVWNNQLQNVLLIWGFTFVFLGGLVFSLGISRESSRGAILWFAISGIVGLLINRLFWARLHRASTRCRLSGRPASNRHRLGFAAGETGTHREPQSARLPCHAAVRDARLISHGAG